MESFAAESAMQNTEDCCEQMVSTEMPCSSEAPGTATGLETCVADADVALLKANAPLALCVSQCHGGANGVYVRCGSHDGEPMYRRLKDESEAAYLYIWDGEGDESCAGWYVAGDPKQDAENEYLEFWNSTESLPLPMQGDCEGHMEACTLNEDSVRCAFAALPETLQQTFVSALESTVALAREHAVRTQAEQRCEKTGCDEIGDQIGDVDDVAERHEHQTADPELDKAPAASEVEEGGEQEMQAMEDTEAADQAETKRKEAEATAARVLEEERASMAAEVAEAAALARRAEEKRKEAVASAAQALEEEKARIAAEAERARFELQEKEAAATEAARQAEEKRQREEQKERALRAAEEERAALESQEREATEAARQAEEERCDRETATAERAEQERLAKEARETSLKRAREDLRLDEVEAGTKEAASGSPLKRAKTLLDRLLLKGCIGPRVASFTSAVCSQPQNISKQVPRSTAVPCVQRDQSQVAVVEQKSMTPQTAQPKHAAKQAEKTEAAAVPCQQSQKASSSEEPGQPTEAKKETKKGAKKEAKAKKTREPAGTKLESQVAVENSKFISPEKKCHDSLQVASSSSVAEPRRVQSTKFVDDSLRRGVVIRLCNLQSTPHLNGKLGLCLYPGQDDRWVVHLDSEDPGSFRNVRPQNLQFVCCGGEVPPAQSSVCESVATPLAECEAATETNSSSGSPQEQQSGTPVEPEQESELEVVLKRKLEEKEKELQHVASLSLADQLAALEREQLGEHICKKRAIDGQASGVDGLIEDVLTMPDAPLVKRLMSSTMEDLAQVVSPEVMAYIVLSRTRQAQKGGC